MNPIRPDRITYYARALLWAIVCPVAHVVFIQSDEISLLDLPPSLPSWFFAWIATLCFTIAVPKRRPAVAVGFIWVSYVFGGLLFNLTWNLAWVLIQATFTALVWSVFEWQEHLYAELRNHIDSMLTAKITESRIRPHFLFNLLNSLSALAPNGSSLRQGIDDASELFRYTLSRNSALTTIEEEIFLTEGYLRLESLRLGDRLNVHWIIDDIVDEINPCIPGLILQPIVENAIRHGIEHTDGEIKIHIYKSYSHLVVEVSNPYVENTKSTGLGIAEKDIRQRLLLLYDRQASYTRNTSKNIVITKVLVPWLTMNESSNAALDNSH